MKFLCSMDFWQKLWYDLGKTYPCEAFMNSILSDSDLQKTVALFGFSVSVRYIAAAVLAVLAVAACALLRKIIFPALARSRPGWKILFNGFARPVSFLGAADAFVECAELPEAPVFGIAFPRVPQRLYPAAGPGPVGQQPGVQHYAAPVCACFQ